MVHQFACPVCCVQKNFQILKVFLHMSFKLFIHKASLLFAIFLHYSFHVGSGTKVLRFFYLLHFICGIISVPQYKFNLSVVPFNYKVERSDDDGPVIPVINPM